MTEKLLHLSKHYGH